MIAEVATLAVQIALLSTAVVAAVYLAAEPFLARRRP